MYAMRFCIVRPMLVGQPHVELDLQLSEGLFFASVMSMVLLAAAGNIINDYFDVRVDRINKPRKVIVGKTVKRRVAMVAHQAINGVAVLLGLIVCWATGFWILGIIPVFIAGSLWYYSVAFKKQVLLGNFVVALMVGIIPLWAGVFELLAIAGTHGGSVTGINDLVIAIFRWLIAFSAFAFLLTLVREAQKDMQDLRGDAAVGFRTLPAVYGTSVTKTYSIILLLVVIAGVIWAAFLKIGIQTVNWSMAGFLVLVVLIPLAFSILKTATGKSSRDFGQASLATKIAMGGGILFCGVIYVLLSS
jgi:4-hydroxybenzoate polyprenyltransferase